MTESLREAVEREMLTKLTILDTHVRWIAIGDAVEVAVRLVEKERKTLWAMEINQDESDECAAELFGLACAVLDGKPEAAEARTKLAAHIEHVRKCRKGSCDTELHGSKQRQRAEAAEKALAEYRSKWQHVVRCECHGVFEPVIDPRCAQPGGGEHE